MSLIQTTKVHQPEGSSAPVLLLEVQGDWRRRERLAAEENVEELWKVAAELGARMA